jgi:SAM-dependent methyltransferase
MIVLSEATRAAIREVPYFRDSQYVGLDVPATLDYFKRAFADQIRIRPLTAGHVLTDVGTGFGWLAMALAMFTPARVVAIEYEPARLEAARRIADLLGLDGRIDWRVGALQETTLGDRESDVTFCIEVLEHVQRDPAAFVELARITRHYLVFTTPNGAFPVIAHDTRLPGCHWLPMPLRDLYARALGRSSMQEGNRFWRPGDLRKHLPDFRRVSGFLNYAGLDDYYRLYPFYLPYGAGSWRRAPSPSRKLYFGLVSRFGAATPYFLPSLAGIFERVGD